MSLAEVAVTQPRSSRPLFRGESATIGLILAEFLFLTLCICSTLPRYLASRQVLFADDAYYYFVIAKNLALYHQSTFDGFTSTNGYHPLWLAILALQYRLFGESFLLTRGIEICLGMIGLFSSLCFVSFSGVLEQLLFSAGFYFILSSVGLNGMETALFVCSFCVFAYCSSLRSTNILLWGLLDGVLALLTIASRVDAAVFVLPLLFLASESKLRRAISFLVVVAGGLCYVGANWLYFGVEFPISGEVKSLGGFQVNRRFLSDLTQITKSSSALIYLAVVLAVCSVAILLKKPNKTVRSVLLAYIIGLTLFCLRLSLFSSWVIWPWYGYPVLVGYLGCAPALCIFFGKQLKPLLGGNTVYVMAGIGYLSLLGVATLKIHRGHFKNPYGFYEINKRLISDYGTVLSQSRVAMGDRAGEFSYLYVGEVNQLEGLVNDRRYFETLRNHGAVKSLLCERDVKFLLSYEPDLGSYSTHEVQTIRSELSQYSAPTVKVDQREEVGRVADLSLFKDQDREKRSYLYLWRLDCGQKLVVGRSKGPQ